MEAKPWPRKGRPVGEVREPFALSHEHGGGTQMSSSDRTPIFRRRGDPGSCPVSGTQRLAKSYSRRYRLLIAFDGSGLYKLRLRQRRLRFQRP